MLQIVVVMIDQKSKKNVRMKTTIMISRCAEITK